MIKKANKFFIEKNYQEALALYKKLIEKNILYSSILEYNIEICKKHLPKVKVKVNDIPTNLEKLLSSNLTLNITDKTLPNINDLQILFHSLENDTLNDSQITSIITVAKSSPFQIKLLNYIRTLLVKNKYKDLLYSIPLGLNIATMIKLATDKSYWLTYRSIIKQQNSILYKEDFLFYELIQYSQYKTKLNKWNKNYQINTEIKNTLHKDKTVAIGTILLNEQKFIGLSLYQHYDFCDKWVLVEGTCLGYPTRKVTENGFSKDLTPKIIEIFPDPKNKIRYIQYGWTTYDGEDAKSELRNEYLKYINEDILIVLDADEFYKYEDLKEAVEKLDNPKIHGVTLPQVHFWKNTKQYITGEYYDISHTRIYRNIIGMKYIRNHNFPELNGEFIHKLGHFKYKRTQNKKDDGYFFKEPCCYHMGFAKDYEDMKDKSDYYINRGEDKTRKSTTASRAAWFNNDIPEKCRIKKWNGSIPTILKGDVI